MTVLLHTEFEKLNKGMEKARAVIAKEGVPSFYTRVLVTLEDTISAVRSSEQLCRCLVLAVCW